tara:strand:- start:17139 stop:17489 length:351 start_codon:yes stop_codon:yes gene_type:complete
LKRIPAPTIPAPAITIIFLLIDGFWVATGSLFVVVGFVASLGLSARSRMTGVTLGGLILGSLGRIGLLTLEDGPGAMEIVGRILPMEETGWIAVFNSVGKVGSSIIFPKPGELSSL